MSVLAVYHVKSNQWASTRAVSSGATCWNRTDVAAPTAMSVPMPMLVLRFKNASSRPVIVADRVQRSPPAPSAAPTPVPTIEPASATEIPAIPIESTIVPEPAPQPVATPAPAPALAVAPEPAKNPEPPPPRHNRFELIIDSLPHQTLVEPIPVTVDPLGGDFFTATMTGLDITTTGASVGETLLLLKDQIETIYTTLSQQSQLDDGQTAMLHKLHGYIAKEPKKSHWFMR